MSISISRTMRRAGIRIRVRAFSCDERGATNHVMVSDDGSVRAYDDVAGHYTAVHSISFRARRRIVRRWNELKGTAYPVS